MKVSQPLYSMSRSASPSAMERPLSGQSFRACGLTSAATWSEAEPPAGTVSVSLAGLMVTPASASSASWNRKATS